MSKLKPCPFCGNKAEVYEECELIKIRCSNYMCQASVNSWHDEVEDAIDAWNKRSADRPQGAWIEMGQNEDGTHNVKCNQCDSAYKMRGHAKSISTKLKYRFCPHCGARMKGADDEDD